MPTFSSNLFMVLFLVSLPLVFTQLDETQRLTVAGGIESDDSNRDFDQITAFSENGRTLVVGTPCQDVDGRPYAGSVLVYEKDDSNAWMLQQTLVLPPTHTSDHHAFGLSVSIAMSTIAVGAIWKDARDEDNEYFAFLFFGLIEPEEGWVYEMSRKTAEKRSVDPGIDECLPWDMRVVLNGDLFAFTGPTTLMGAIQVFPHLGEGQIYVDARQTIRPDRLSSSFGHAITAHRDKLYVSAPFERISDIEDYDITGAIYVFQVGPSSYTQLQRIEETEWYHVMGQKMSTDGDYLVALSNDDNWFQRGLVPINVYSVQASGELVLQETISGYSASYTGGTTYVQVANGILLVFSPAAEDDVDWTINTGYFVLGEDNSDSIATPITSLEAGRPHPIREAIAIAISDDTMAITSIDRSSLEGRVHLVDMRPGVCDIDFTLPLLRLLAQLLQCALSLLEP